MIWIYEEVFSTFQLSLELSEFLLYLNPWWHEFLNLCKVANFYIFVCTYLNNLLKTVDWYFNIWFEQKIIKSCNLIVFQANIREGFILNKYIYSQLGIVPLSFANAIWHLPFCCYWYMDVKIVEPSPIFFGILTSSLIVKHSIS